MSEGTMSPADMMAMMNGGNGTNGAWNNPFMYLIWLALFGNGAFGWGNRAAASDALTRAELTDGLNNQTLQNDLRTVDSNINNGFDNVSQSLCAGFGGVNSNMNNSTNTITGAITNTAFGTTQAIHDLQSTNQLGFCGVNNNINGLKYEMAQNCCDLKTAMHSEGEATRSMIQNNSIQELRDKLADKSSELQAAQLTLANANQTQNILNSLGKYVPTTNCGCNW